MANLLIHAGRVVWVVAVLLICLAGCQPNKPPEAPAPAGINFTQRLPDGQVALEKISPAAYPDFSRALLTENLSDLRKSCENSLTWLGRPSSKRKFPYLDINHERAVASVRAMIELIDSGTFALPSNQFNERIAADFDVYQSIGGYAADGSGYTHKVLFTGYFTPTYDASLVRGGEYQWPLYRRPADLISDGTTDTAGRKSADGTIVPYLTRREIESGALAGQELVWLASRWNAYVITVQGSARLRMPDGKVMEVGYTGSNGHPYVGPGLKMIADGIIAEKDLSFETMRQYFASHPEAMDKYLWQNPRTVFFQEVHGGPFGALNVPVTKLASIATDKDVYPPGMVAFLKVPIPAMESGLPQAVGTNASTEFSGFLLDQDRGGAIRSAGRCDIYMGIGQRAEQTAGHQLNAGEMYYLAIKPDRMGH